MIRGASARKCGQNIRNARVVAKRLADMCEAVDIGGAKNEACTELEGIFAKFMLTVARGVGTFARNGVVATQQVKEVRAPQFGGAVRGAIHINQKRKRDASLFPECSRIMKIAHPNRSEISSARPDFTLMLAQLRDVLAAKHSAVMTQKNDHGWLRLPQRTEAQGTLVGIGKNDCGQLGAKAFCHHLFGTLSPTEFNARWGQAHRAAAMGPAHAEGSCMICLHAKTKG
jgi:hypothetical protein